MAAMTYESIVETTRSKFSEVNVSQVQGTTAFQINIEGKAVNGIFISKLKTVRCMLSPMNIMTEMPSFTSTVLIGSNSSTASSIR